MPILGGHFKDLVGRYHGPEGDVFALEELLPVAGRFVSPAGRVLEVGCGYGRNLVAIAQLDPPPGSWLAPTWIDRSCAAL